MARVAMEIVMIIIMEKMAIVVAVVVGVMKKII